jgi:dUTPase
VVQRFQDYQVILEVLLDRLVPAVQEVPLHHQDQVVQVVVVGVEMVEVVEVQTSNT